MRPAAFRRSMLVIALTSVCTAATITVDRNGGGDFAEIQPAFGEKTQTKVNRFDT